MKLEWKHKSPSRIVLRHRFEFYRLAGTYEQLRVIELVPEHGAKGEVDWVEPGDVRYEKIH